MKIIICDDYPVIVKNLIRDIKQIVPQAECVGFSKAKEAQAYAQENATDVAILDINMPEISGLTLAQIIQKKNPRVNIIFVTGYPEYALEAHELYASSFLVKPVTAKALKKAFENLRNPVANLTSDVIQNFYEGKIKLGTNIRRLRAERDLSVQEFADAMDVTAQTVYRWENNERLPDIVKLVIISDFFGVDIRTLLR